MKLTWNQRRALENLSRSIGSATSSELSDAYHGIYPYLCGASARTALMALARKGLAECIPTSPIRYKITSAGRAALAAKEGEQR